jgi:putative transposase
MQQNRLEGQRRGFAVKKSQCTEEQIAFTLRQQELRTPVDEVCCKMGVCRQAFYRWKKQYAGLGHDALRDDSGNWRLKRMMADLSLDKVIQNMLSKEL